MYLPIEILHVIFQYLKQRHLRNCLLVCRAWHVATQPLLYQSIEFYSRRQLEKFIDTRRDSHTTSGNYVQNLQIYSRLASKDIDYRSLHQLCPNVKTVSIRHSGTTTIIPRTLQPWLVENWKQLTMLALNWSEYSDDSWKSKADQLKQLSVGPSAPSCRGMLSSLLPPFLLSLAQLSISFQALHPTYPENTFFDYLAESCPSLTTLALNGIMYTYRSSDDTASTESVATVSKVTALTMSVFYDFNKAEFFESYTKVFPNINCLDLKINRGRQDNTESEINAESHRMALYHFITSFQRLTSLTVDHPASSLGQPSSDVFLPTAMIADWLSGSRVTSLGWSDHYLFKLRGHVRLSYFNQLTSLTVKTTLEFKNLDLLRALSFGNARRTIPDQLQSLEVRSVSYDCIPSVFDLSEWAKASPRLKQLTIRRFMILNHSRNSNNGQIHGFRQVENLKLENVSIVSEDGFTSLAQHFPLLKKFYCSSPSWFLNHRPGHDEELLLTMKTPCWQLEYFYFSKSVVCFHQKFTVNHVRLREGDGTKVCELLDLNREDSPAFGCDPVFMGMCLWLKSVDRISFDI